jgi:hypothetical protein
MNAPNESHLSALAGEAKAKQLVNMAVALNSDEIEFINWALRSHQEAYIVGVLNEQAASIFGNGIDLSGKDKEINGRLAGAFRYARQSDEVVKRIRWKLCNALEIAIQKSEPGSS